MAGGVAGRRDDHHVAVAEHVVIAFELGHRMLRLEPRTDRRRPFILGLLHQQHGLREHGHVSDVIGMGMGDGDEFDVGGLHAELIELGRQRLRPPPVSHARIGGALTVGHGGDGVRQAGVPQQPALAVLDQVTGIDEIHRLADVHAWRPARNVARDALPAIQDIEALHSGVAPARGRVAARFGCTSAAAKIRQRPRISSRSSAMCRFSGAISGQCGLGQVVIAYNNMVLRRARCPFRRHETGARHSSFAPHVLLTMPPGW